MHAMTELRERRHALLFTVEQGCRRRGVTRWADLRRYLLAVTQTTQGRDLLLDAVEVDAYISLRQQSHKHTPADRTAARLLATRDRQVADRFAHLIDALPQATR